MTQNELSEAIAARRFASAMRRALHRVLEGESSERRQDRGREAMTMKARVTKEEVGALSETYQAVNLVRGLLESSQGVCT